MANHLGKFILFFLLVLSSCKKQIEQENINTQQKNVVIDNNIEVVKKCITKEEINNFKSLISKMIEEKDTISIAKMVKLPYNSSGKVVKNPEEFISQDYSIITEYFLEEMIDDDEKNDLVREEVLQKNNDTKKCKYIIKNDFPNIEFNVWFSIEKLDNKLFFTEIMFAG